MIIRTVLGDISPADFGPCDAHEHLFLDTPAQPGEEFLDRDKAVEEPAKHTETASTGAMLQLDGPGRAKYWPDSTIIALIAALADAGHAERLLVGGDT